MIGISTGYFFVVVLILGYALRPLFLMAMTVSPRHGGLATPENHKLENIGTVVYLTMAGYVYYIIMKSLKAKANAAKENAPAVAANSE